MSSIEANESTSYHSSPRTRTILALCTVFLAILLSARYAPPYHQLNRDSGVFLYGGASILRGGLPYRDFWDHKPPLVYFVDAAGLEAGHGRWGVWGVETLLFAVSSCLFFLLSMDAVGTWPAAAGTAFVASAARNPRLFEGGNLTEGYALCLVMVMLGIAAARPRHGRWWLLAGVLGTSVFFLKESCIAVPVGLALSLAVATVAPWPGRDHRPLPWYLTACSLTAAVLVGLLWAAGILHEFYLSNFVFSRLYIGQQTPPPTLLNGVRRLFSSAHGLGLLGVTALSWGSALWSVTRGHRSPSHGESQRIVALVVAGAIPMELLFVALSGRYYGHYFLTLIASTGVGIAIFAQGATQAVVRSWRPASPRAATAVFALVAAVLVLVPGSSRGGLHAAAEWIVRRRTVPNDPAVMRYLSSRPQEEGLLILGMETRWNVLSRRAAPTRYTYITPLLYRQFDQDRRLAEYLTALHQHPRTLLIDTFGMIDPNASPAFCDPARRVYFEKLRARFPPQWLAAFRRMVRAGWRRDRVLPRGWVSYVPRGPGSTVLAAPAPPHVQSVQAVTGQ